MEVVLSWKLLFSTHAWHSIRFSTQAPLHALFIPVLIGLCSYNNVLAIWGHSWWKLTLTQIVSLRAFLLFWPPFWILKRVAAVHLFPDSRSRFPVPRSPFPVPRSPFLVLVTSVFRGPCETSRLLSSYLFFDVATWKAFAGLPLLKTLFSHFAFPNLLNLGSKNPLNLS